MINLQKKAIELEPNKWNKFKIKIGFTEIPNHACSTIQDFLDNKNQIKISDTIFFPTLNYLGTNQETREKMKYELTKIELQDATGKIEVYVRPTMALGLVTKDLYQLWAGGKLTNVEIMNGIQWPGDKKPDEKLYLRNFTFHNLKQKKFSEKLSELINELSPEYQGESITIKN